MFALILEGFCPPPTPPLSAQRDFSPRLAPYFWCFITPSTTPDTPEPPQPFSLHGSTHSFRHTWGYACSARTSAQSLPGFSTAPLLCTRCNARNSNPFKYLLHSSLCTREWGSAPGKSPLLLFLRPVGSQPGRHLQTLGRKTFLRLTNTPFFLQLSTFDCSTLQVQSPHITLGDR